LWWADAELLERRAPPAPAAVRILSPFDNAVILRHRVNALFDFDYQIECYVKAENRRFGYFCLPLLYRDRIVGRMDCKAHRASGELNIKQLHIERNVDEGFFAALASAAADFADFNGCPEVTLDQCHPTDLKPAVTSCLI
ncbi:MAG: winged helix-turn-helix domain-containing protein, partial [Gammaproteobacteria bacterium]|nr:winged helix-turn-helix domain-containing protein [Gammaproteobacteria bacterium]